MLYDTTPLSYIGNMSPGRLPLSAFTPPMHGYDLTLLNPRGNVELTPRGVKPYHLA